MYRVSDNVVEYVIVITEEHIERTWNPDPLWRPLYGGATPLEDYLIGVVKSPANEESLSRALGNASLQPSSDQKHYGLQHDVETQVWYGIIRVPVMPLPVPSGPHPSGKDQMRHERDLLADCLGRILVASGVSEEVPLTGPQLLLLAEDFIGHLKKLASGRPLKEPIPGKWVTELWNKEKEHWTIWTEDERLEQVLEDFFDLRSGQLQSYTALRLTWGKHE